MTLSAQSLKVKIFADGADRAAILELCKDPVIKGFTTNPTLMRKAGVTQYEAFAKDVLREIENRPISFEVFSDEFAEMEAQAMRLASWGENVYVKIPVTNTRGNSSAPVMARLARRGVKVNATALLTVAQVQEVAHALAGGPRSIISVFAGRIADTGVDPLPVMKAALEVVAPYSNIEIIWASPRELFNVVQADQIRCHIITVTPDLLKKLPMLGRDLGEVSLDTVRMFHRDAAAAGYTL
ncbi:MAG TPA: transaldolase [Myxococcales bacterium]|nr:transaldolase [Myxococcales bacterium]